MAETVMGSRADVGGVLGSYSGGLRPLVSWRSVVAGFVVTLLTFATLISLGIAVGGIALNEVIQQGGARGLSIGAGIWMLVSALLSLFAGCYFAGRISTFATPRVGAAHGLVISSLFFGFLLMQLGNTVGMVGRGVGSAVGGAGDAVSGLASRPEVQSVVERSMGDLNLKADPTTVVQGVATRLLRGDQEGARNYLAWQAGIPPAEAQKRLQQASGQVTQVAEQIGTGAARAISGLGWTLFGMMVLGTLAALLGGSLGSRENITHPIVEREVNLTRREAPVGV